VSSVSAALYANCSSADQARPANTLV